jgi:hypothetical protein
MEPEVDKVEYRVIVDDDLTGFVARVNAAIRYGWAPQGGIFVLEALNASESTISLGKDRAVKITPQKKLLYHQPMIRLHMAAPVEPEP